MDPGQAIMVRKPSGDPTDGLGLVFQTRSAPTNCAAYFDLLLLPKCYPTTLTFSRSIGYFVPHSSFEGNVLKIETSHFFVQHY